MCFCLLCLSWSLLLKEYANKMSLGKLFHRIVILLRRKCCLGCFLMFAHERAELDVLFYFAPVLVFCFHRNSLPSLDHTQSWKSVWNCLFIVLFSVLSYLKSFKSFFARQLEWFFVRVAIRWTLSIVYFKSQIFFLFYKLKFF